MVARSQLMLLAWESAFDTFIEACGRYCYLGASLTVLSAERMELVIVDFTDSSKVWGVTRLLRMGQCSSQALNNTQHMTGLSGNHVRYRRVYNRLNHHSY